MTVTSKSRLLIRTLSRRRAKVPGVRFERNAMGSRGTGRQDCVASDIRAHVRKEITWAKRVKNGGHVLELLETAVQIPSRSGHAWRGEESGRVDERYRNRPMKEATADLPREISSKCR